MRRSLVLIILVLYFFSLSPASCGVTSVDISPSEPVQGDMLTVDVTANPGEQVSVQIKFKKDLQVSGGMYLLELDGVEIPQKPNSFSVKATNVNNLVLAVKLLGIWISVTKEASNGVASISQGGVPSGSYDTQIKGDAALGASEVTIEVTAVTTLTMDSEGHYRYGFDTSSIPPGTFNVNVGGVTKTVTLSEAKPIPPTAQFSLPGEAIAGKSLTFDASSSTDTDGTIVDYQWDMGDGTLVDGKVVTHTYSAPGLYSVVLTVVDNHGFKGTHVEPLEVLKAPNVAPVPVVTTERRCFTGQLVGFSAYSSYDPDGVIALYVWNFGDTYSGEGLSVTHRYTSPGVYNVTLIVTDDGGLGTSVLIRVHVVDPPTGRLGVVEVSVSEGDTVSLPEIGGLLRVNATGPTPILVFQYQGNPYPDVLLPSGHVGKIIDVSVGDPDLIRWPLYLELKYNRSQVSSESEARLGFFHFDDGWVQCRETGINVEESIVWALLWSDEVIGSTFSLGLKSQLEGAAIRRLVLSAEEVKPGVEASASVEILNLADAASFSIMLEVNSEPYSVRTVFLGVRESKWVHWTLIFDAPGTYQIKVGDHVKTLTVLRARAVEPDTGDFTLVLVFGVVFAILVVGLISYDAGSRKPMPLVMG